VLRTARWAPFLSEPAIAVDRAPYVRVTPIPNRATFVEVHHRADYRMELVARASTEMDHILMSAFVSLDRTARYKERQ